jgi:Molydopterin dinucleotide binding domain
MTCDRSRRSSRAWPGFPARIEDAVGRLRRGLRSDPRQAGGGDRGIRGLQPPGPPAAGVPAQQPARELVFLTDTGRANFSAAPLAEVAPAPGRLLLGTMRSHDQWNTTIYSDDDRYRGVKNLRTLVFMNREDMSDRGLEKYDLVDITSFAKDGSKRSVRGTGRCPMTCHVSPRWATCPSSTFSLCPIGDYSAQSDQPLMKHLVVEITPSGAPES